MEKIVLLGATGSIGKSTLDVIRHFPERFQLEGVSGYSNYGRLEKIIEEFHPNTVCLKDENNSFTHKFPKIQFLFGESGLIELARYSFAGTAVIAISGIAGLSPTLSAIESGKRLLSANKEALVAAGGIINKSLQKFHNTIIPLDSEHNAIFNLYQKFNPKDIRSIYLTASGGPFLNKKITDKTVLEEVLEHPNWDMGNYITVNSATLMNKGFEVIEAHYLFHMDYDKIKVLIHPQSLVHGLIEQLDGSYFMAASPCDMRYPIALSLFNPEIPAHSFPKLQLAQKKLEFFEPDLKKFPLLKLSYEIGKENGLLPAVLNAANEIAVNAFLKKSISFIAIPEMIQKTIDQFIRQNPNNSSPELDEIYEADQVARTIAMNLLSAALPPAS